MLNFVSCQKNFFLYIPRVRLTKKNNKRHKTPLNTETKRARRSRIDSLEDFLRLGGQFPSGNRLVHVKRFHNLYNFLKILN